MYMMKSLSNKLYLKKQLYGLHMKEETVVLEHQNFFNKVIIELLVVDVKIDEKDKTILFSSLLVMITSSSPCSTIKKLSFWRRSRQLSYLMRLEKDQIKRSKKDLVWWSQEGKEEKERNVRPRQRHVTFVTGKIIEIMIASIRKSG